jgi:hypothetical protein
MRVDKKKGSRMDRQAGRLFIRSWFKKNGNFSYRFYPREEIPLQRLKESHNVQPPIVPELAPENLNVTSVSDE